MALSTSARVTGDRADALFIDDPTDADDAYSESARTAANNWYDSAFANRLNDLRTGTRCLIMQRLHPDDLAGHILEREAGEWEVLTIPQMWEESRRTVTSLGWTDPRNTVGELAFPARFPADVIALERLRLGESGFAGQHQQRPFAAGGEIFKESGLRLWPASEELPKLSAITISIDSAFKTGEENDYSVAVVLGEFGRGVFILDVVRGRLAYPQLRAVMIELWQKWRASAVLVEDKASGQSLIQDLQQSTKLPVRPVKVDGDKLSRAHTVVPTWEAGRVFAQEGAPFLPKLLAELTAFPKSAHDDQVDAFVQGVRYATGSSDGRGFFKWLAEERARKIVEGLLPPDPPVGAAHGT
jgi:predicted phage terminase large subunit-like protein